MDDEPLVLLSEPVDVDPLDEPVSVICIVVTEEDVASVVDVVVAVPDGGGDVSVADSAVLDPVVVPEVESVCASSPETHSSAKPSPASFPNRRPEGHAASSKLQNPADSQKPGIPANVQSSSPPHANTSWRVQANNSAPHDRPNQTPRIRD